MQAITKSETELRAVPDSSIVSWFINQLDASEKTRATYQRSLKQWLLFLQGNNQTILTANRQTVLTFKEYHEQEHKAATVNAYLCAVRSLYSTLEAEGIKANIAASVKGVRRAQNSPKDALTITQTRELISDKPQAGASLKALRDYALVNLLTRRGLRTIEAARANIGDIRQINGEAVLYIQGKGYGDKSDFVILNKQCLEPIYTYLEARGCKDLNAPLFACISNRNQGGRMTSRSISRIVKTTFKKHGIEAASLTAHSLRHTAVTLALLGDASLQDVQAMARHKNINTTMIYAHNLNRMKAGAEHAIDALLETV